MIARVAGGRQPPALDRVGEDHAGAVGDGVARGEGLEQLRHVVTAEVADESGAGGVVVLPQEGGDVVGGAVEEPGAGVIVRQPEGGLVLLVGHAVQPGAERLPTGLAERLDLASSVLHLDDVPAARLELRAPLVDADARHDAVEGLAVEVDDPHDVAEAAGRRVGHGLPDVALVELGVADDRDEAGPRPRPGVRIDVAPCGCGEQRCCRTEADRAGGEVDAVGVLRPGGVRLQPAELAEPSEVRLVEVAEQVRDGVQHGGGVRLDAHPVGRVEVREPQGRHDRDERGAGRLVPADLEAVGVRALPVGVVDHPDRQPQHPCGDRVQRLLLMHGSVPSRGR